MKDSVFNLLSSDSAIVQKFKPKFLTRGGECLVYIIPNHPEIIVKVSTHKIKDFLIEIFKDEEERTEDEIEHSFKQIYQRDTTEKNVSVRKLQLFFGKEHTLSERRILMKIPISNQLMKTLFIDDYKKRSMPVSAKKLEEVWTEIIFQKSVLPIFELPHLSFSFGKYCEDMSIDEKEYGEITTQLLGNSLEQKFDSRKFFRLQDASNEKCLTQLLIKAESDVGLRLSVSDFIKQAIHYSEGTGQILGMAGKNNIIFFNKDDQWNYLLLDACPMFNEPILNFTKQLLRDNTDVEQLNGRQKEILKRGLNFIRVVNGAAILIGVKERIKIGNVVLEKEFLNKLKLKKFDDTF